MDEITLTPEQLEEIERAHAAHLAGEPGELRFEIAITRADGKVDKHTLTGTIDDTA